ncbi:MAG TPA: GNAT family protein [Bacteroidales bacterium]
MLKKENIVLRSPEPADVDFIFKMENDQSLWHLSNTLTPFSRFDLEQFVMLSEKDIYVTKQARFIIEKTEGSLAKTIGAIDLFDFEPQHKRAGIGIMLLEHERGHGYAGLALDILIDYSFSVLGLHQLFCNIEEDNEISLKLFQNKGFRVAGRKEDWNLRNNKWKTEILLQLINNW